MGSSKRIIFTIVVNACRWVLALVLIVSGFVKAVDPVGSMYKLQEYAAAFSVGAFSYDALLFFAILQAVLEFLVGIGLLMGIYRRFMTLLAPLMMLFFTVLTLFIYLDDSVADCGCFGEALTLSNGETLVKNIFLLLLSVMVFIGRRRFLYYISAKSRWMVTIFATFYIAFASLMSLSHLPMVNFSPYEVGADLRYLTEGEPGEYRVVDVYERDGEQQECSAGEKPDASWNFVESRPVLVEEAVLPLISNLSIMDWEADIDMVPGILADSGYVCIAVLEDVTRASVSRVDRINELYDYCLENDIPFYAATASEDEAVDLWRKRTGAEYPVYWAEESVLRLMVRANPGVMLLKDGVIVGKWNIADLPAVEEYSMSATGMPDSIGMLVDGMRGWRFWLLLLALPLLVIAVLDVMACRNDNKDKPDDVIASGEQE